jgi:hypothetical protein
MWAELQATLEEIELSASGGTRVFGPDHDRKLAELRLAQIALAQAWARSEADEATETTTAEGEARNLKGQGNGPAEAAISKGAGPDGKGDGSGNEAAKVSVADGGTRPGSSSGAVRLGPTLEEETEADILFAKKRREANDRYFQRVNQGVLNVVAKLEDVAVAMRAVEQESKDIWGDNEPEQQSVASVEKRSSHR